MKIAHPQINIKRISKGILKVPNTNQTILYNVCPTIPNRQIAIIDKIMKQTNNRICPIFVCCVFLFFFAGVFFFLAFATFITPYCCVLISNITLKIIGFFPILLDKYFATLSRISFRVSRLLYVLFFTASSMVCSIILETSVFK